MAVIPALFSPDRATSSHTATSAGWDNVVTTTSPNLAGPGDSAAKAPGTAALTLATRQITAGWYGQSPSTRPSNHQWRLRSPTHVILTAWRV
jgi:hypothetical protein